MDGLETEMPNTYVLERLDALTDRVARVEVRQEVAIGSVTSELERMAEFRDAATEWLRRATYAGVIGALIVITRAPAENIEAIVRGIEAAKKIMLLGAGVI